MLKELIFRNIYRQFATSKFGSYKDVPLERHELKTNFMRSSGPGGQSVNTTNSKAEIRIDMNECSIFEDDYIKKRFLEKYKNYINREGEIIIRSQIHKNQNSNLEDCISRAKKMIYECSLVQEERRYDIPAESEEIREKRLNSKKKKSEVKSRRQNTKFLY